MFLIEKLIYLIFYGTTDPEGQIKKKQIESMKRRRRK
tara:strand:- start:832 stop:942 length:111 start_codon:yes stop_codon:yes gene_type:complete